MTVRSGILSIFTAVLAMLTALIAAAGATAFAGTTGDGNRAPGPRPLANVVTYAIHRQALSADGTSTWGVACPAGAVPVGGGTIAQDPLIESVTQAGFHTSTATGRFDGYQASVRVRGLRAGRAVLFTVQVACVRAAVSIIYAVRTQVFPVNGTSFWGVPCPAGAVAAGGGTVVQDPLVETVDQAGFHPGAATGRFDGYQASVRVSGLPAGRAVLFAVQVACVRAATPPAYGPRAKIPRAGGTVWTVTCPAGTIPLGGGTTVQDPQSRTRSVLLARQNSSQAACKGRKPADTAELTPGGNCRQTSAGLASSWEGLVPDSGRSVTTGNGGAAADRHGPLGPCSVTFGSSRSRPCGPR
jgi:hypothetical protein